MPSPKIIMDFGKHIVVGKGDSWVAIPFVLILAAIAVIVAWFILNIKAIITLLLIFVVIAAIIFLAIAGYETFSNRPPF